MRNHVTNANSKPMMSVGKIGRRTGNVIKKKRNANNKVDDDFEDYFSASEAEQSLDVTNSSQLSAKESSSKDSNTAEAPTGEMKIGRRTGKLLQKKKNINSQTDSFNDYFSSDNEESLNVTNCSVLTSKENLTADNPRPEHGVTNKKKIHDSLVEPKPNLQVKVGLGDSDGLPKETKIGRRTGKPIHRKRNVGSEADVFSDYLSSDAEQSLHVTISPVTSEANISCRPPVPIGTSIELTNQAEHSKSMKSSGSSAPGSTHTKEDHDELTADENLYNNNSLTAKTHSTAFEDIEDPLSVLSPSTCRSSRSLGRNTSTRSPVPTSVKIPEKKKDVSSNKSAILVEDKTSTKSKNETSDKSLTEMVAPRSSSKQSVRSAARSIDTSKDKISVLHNQSLRKKALMNSTSKRKDNSKNSNESELVSDSRQILSEQEDCNAAANKIHSHERNDSGTSVSGTGQKETLNTENTNSPKRQAKSKNDQSLLNGSLSSVQNKHGEKKNVKVKQNQKSQIPIRNANCREKTEDLTVGTNVASPDLGKSKLVGKSRINDMNKTLGSSQKTDVRKGDRNGQNGEVKSKVLISKETVESDTTVSPKQNRRSGYTSYSSSSLSSLGHHKASSTKSKQSSMSDEERKEVRISSNRERKDGFDGGDVNRNSETEAAYESHRKDVDTSTNKKAKKVNTLKLSADECVITSEQKLRSRRGLFDDRGLGSSPTASKNNMASTKINSEKKSNASQNDELNLKKMNYKFDDSDEEVDENQTDGSEKNAGSDEKATTVFEKEKELNSVTDSKRNRKSINMMTGSNCKTGEVHKNQDNFVSISSNTLGRKSSSSLSHHGASETGFVSVSSNCITDTSIQSIAQRKSLHKGSAGSSNKPPDVGPIAGGSGGNSDPNKSLEIKIPETVNADVDRKSRRISKSTLPVINETDQVFLSIAPNVSNGQDYQTETKPRKGTKIKLKKKTHKEAQVRETTGKYQESEMVLKSEEKTGPAVNNKKIKQPKKKCSIGITSCKSTSKDNNSVKPVRKGTESQTDILKSRMHNNEIPPLLIENEEVDSKSHTDKGDRHAMLPESPKDMTLTHIPKAGVVKSGSVSSVVYDTPTGANRRKVRKRMLFDSIIREEKAQSGFKYKWDSNIEEEAEPTPMETKRNPRQVKKQTKSQKVRNQPKNKQISTKATSMRRTRARTKQSKEANIEIGVPHSVQQQNENGEAAKVDRLEESVQRIRQIRENDSHPPSLDNEVNVAGVDIREVETELPAARSSDTSDGEINSNDQDNGDELPGNMYRFKDSIVAVYNEPLKSSSTKRKKSSMSGVSTNRKKKSSMSGTSSSRKSVTGQKRKSTKQDEQTVNQSMSSPIVLRLIDCIPNVTPQSGVSFRYSGRFTSASLDEQSPDPGELSRCHTSAALTEGSPNSGNSPSPENKETSQTREQIKKHHQPNKVDLSPRFDYRQKSSNKEPTENSPNEQESSSHVDVYPESIPTTAKRNIPKPKVLSSCLRDSSAPRPTKKKRKVRISNFVKRHSIFGISDAEGESPMPVQGNGDTSSVISDPIVHYAETTIRQSTDPLSLRLPDLSHMIVHPEEVEGLRRSKRTRVKKVNCSRGERVIYKLDETGFGWVVDGVQPSIGLAKLNAIEEKRKERQRKRKHEAMNVPARPKKKRLSIHTKNLPAQELVEDNTLPVLNPENGNEVLIEMVSRQADAVWRGPDMNPSESSDPVAGCVQLKQNLFYTGKIHIRAMSEKPFESTVETLIYHVIHGKLCLTINEKSTIVETGDDFFIPRGSSYRIKNLRRDVAQIHFINLFDKMSMPTDYSG